MRSAAAPSATFTDFLAGGGEMGARMRDFDWSATPLGQSASWPPSLRTLVGVMLGSRQPMLIVWGPDRLTLYNDGYAPMCGDRHPAALGRPFSELWFDIWDQVRPILDRAYAGEPTHMDDIAFVMHRHGYPEEAHFTFSYTPVRDEGGGIGGMFCACAETTSQVLARRHDAAVLALGEITRTVERPHDILRASARLLCERLEVAQAGYAEVDDAQEIATYVEPWSDGSMPLLSGAIRMDDYGPELIADLRAGKTLIVNEIAVDPRAASAEVQAEFDEINARAAVTVPLIRAGRLRAYLFALQPTPRRWSMHDVALLETVADRTWSALERLRAEADLRASAQELYALTDSLPALMSYIGPDQRYRFNNKAYEDWFGHSREEMTGRHMREVLGDAAYENLEPRIAAALRGERVSFEQFVPYKDGGFREVSVDYIPYGEGFYAFVQDIGHRKQVEMALRESEERLQQAKAAAGLGIYDFDLASGAIAWDARVRALWGVDADATITFGTFIRGVHPDDRALVRTLIDKASDPAGGGDYHGEYRVVGAGDGAVTWVEAIAKVLFHENRPVRFVGTVQDITARKKAEEQRELLVNELNHRVKNTLAMVQALAIQSFRGELADAGARAAFQARLYALAAAHDILTRENWDHAGLREVVNQSLAPHFGALASGASRIVIEGPDVRLSPWLALNLAMTLHELATNAVKYGALSGDHGAVRVGWTVEPEADGVRLHLEWRERDGPPVRAPTRFGFGTRLIERSLAGENGSEVSLTFAPEGVVFVLGTILA